MDLLLLAEKMPSTQKAFISRLGLILDPRRDGREANEYRRGNTSLCAPHQRMHAIFIYTYAQSLDTSIQMLHTKTALSFPRLLVSSINIHRNERGNARLLTHKHAEFICCVKLIHRDQQLGKSHYEREWLWNQSGLLSTQVNACVCVCVCAFKLHNCANEIFNDCQPQLTLRCYTDTHWFSHQDTFNSFHLNCPHCLFLICSNTFLFKM